MANSKEPGITPQLETLLSSIEATREKRDIPAIALTLVNKEGLIWSGTFGLADRDTNKKADNDTLFRIGSITKTFTALATYLLVNDGKLDLNEKLKDIAPELDIENRWYDSHPIRIIHLLEHTAGLTDLSKEEFDFNDQLSLAEALERGKVNRVTQWPPGLHYSYTNVGAGYLAYVIEKRSGHSYEDFVSSRIFKPLGMHSAGLFPDDVTLQGLATGYNTDGTSPIPYWNMTFRAFGAINTKPTDMSPFLQLLLNKGRYQGKTLLAEDLFMQMQTPSSTLAARSGLKFGYGSGIYSFFRKGYRFYGHGGDGDGYLSRYGYHPESGMAYFVVINVFRGKDLTKVRNLVEDFIISEQPEHKYPSIQVTEQQLENYKGEYISATWRFPSSRPESIRQQKLTLSIKQGQLYLEQTNSKRRLIPVTTKHFRFEDEPDATMAFVLDEQGQRYLQTDFGNYRQQ